MAYPNIIDSFVTPSGTQTLSSPDHTQDTIDVHTAIVSIETVIGTTQSTGFLNDVLNGQKPVVHQGGTLKTTINGGTLNTINIGTPTLVGGTIQGALVGTSTIQGGTANNVLMGTQNAVGGTFGTPTLVVGSDAARDIYFRSAGGTLTRLGAGTAGQLLQTNGTGTDPIWSSPNNYVYNAMANYSISGTSFSSLDGTNLKGTITTTNSNKVRLLFTTNLTNQVSNATYFQVVRNPAGVPATVFSGGVQEGTLSVIQQMNIELIDNPSTGVNVYDIQTRVSAGTATVGGGSFTVNFALEEVKQ